MTRIYLIPLLLLLASCSFLKQPVPVQQSFPDSVPKLMQGCGKLETIEGDNIPITDLLQTVVRNYTLYYQCADKVQGWQEWYNQQKNIHSKQ